MKRVKMIIHEPLINKAICSELNLLLHEEANLIDAISDVDKVINIKGGFHVSDYRSLLHMVYNPAENRFYKQVAVAAHGEQDKMLNVRNNPKKKLPEEVTIILIPAGGCISEWKEAVDYKEFRKAK